MYHQLTTSTANGKRLFKLVYVRTYMQSMDILSSLCCKDSLETSDVLCLLRCLQEESTPLLTSKQVITPSRNKPILLSPSSKRSSPNMSPSQIDQRRSKGAKSKDTKRSKGRGESLLVEGVAAVHVRGKSIVSLDVNSLKEFPPMTPNKQ